MKEKKSYKKIAFLLIGLQIIAYISPIINNELPFNNLPEFIGFNFFAILGIIFLANEKSNKPTKKIFFYIMIFFLGIVILGLLSSILIPLFS